MTGVILDIRAVSKNYGGLRPLRIERLTVSAGQQVALTGFDQPMAETFVNLVTGAVLPDTGDIAIFGRATGTIEDSTDWLSLVDRFGIVSARAVLLDGLSVAQNLAMPFSIDVEPLSTELRESAAILAREVGLAEALLDLPLASTDQLSQLRVRLGRALALEPAMLLLEHPSAMLDSADGPALGKSIRKIVEQRGIAAVTLTADRRFAGGAAADVLALDPATGRLQPLRFWQR